MPGTDQVLGGLSQIAARIGEFMSPTVILGLMAVIAIVAIYHMNRPWPGLPARPGDRAGASAPARPGQPEYRRARRVDGRTPDMHNDIDD